MGKTRVIVLEVLYHLSVSLCNLTSCSKTWKGMQCVSKEIQSCMNKADRSTLSSCLESRGNSCIYVNILGSSERLV